MKTFQAVKVYTDEQQYLNSPELAEMFSGYENTEKKYAGKWSTFAKAYILQADPTQNYGRSTKVFKVYKHHSDRLKSPLTMIEVTGGGSMISNSPVQLVELTDTGFIVTGISIRKDKMEEALKDWDSRFVVLI